MAKKKSHNDEDISFELLDEDMETVEKPKQEKQEKPHSEKEETIKKEKQDEKPKIEEKEVKPKADSRIQAELEEYKNLLQLSRADFDNYRKRSYTLLQNAKTEGELNVILKFLPALDAFDKAKEMISDANVLKGVEMIEKDLKEKLKSIGVEEMNPLGKVFDPNFHNALSTTSDPSLEDDVITQVYQEGYIYNDKVIRYAQVIINKR